MKFNCNNQLNKFHCLPVSFYITCHQCYGGPYIALVTKHNMSAHQDKGSISAPVHMRPHCKNWHKGTFLQVCAENKSGGMSRDQYRWGKAKYCICIEAHPRVLYLPIFIHISTGDALNSILYFELLLSWYCISLSD